MSQNNINLENFIENVNISVILAAREVLKAAMES